MKTKSKIDWGEIVLPLVLIAIFGWLMTGGYAQLFAGRTEGPTAPSNSGYFEGGQDE